MLEESRGENPYEQLLNLSGTGILCAHCRGANSINEDLVSGVLEIALGWVPKKGTSPEV
jgi:hypothetical protein